MDFGLSREQQQLAEAEETWLSGHDPIQRVRATADSTPIAVDPEAVVHAAETGLLAVLTPEMRGSHFDLAVLTEAHGHAASSLPIADLAIAAWVLDAARAPQAAAAATGDALFGVTCLPSPQEMLSRPIPMLADMAGVVVVSEAEDREFLAVELSPDVEAMATLDLTRSWGRARLGLSGAKRFELPPGTARFVADALALHRGVDALGAANRLLEMSVKYAGQGYEFGTPIGSFQAVKHHCANMALGVETGRSTLLAGAQALDTAASPQQRSRAASSAAAYAKATASEVAATAMQVHGGIGITWEHDLHLLLRRIKVDEGVDGTVAEHRAALMTS
jgi:alkylation response protein AidB-like acyl-CoA dehydrogenase